MASIQLPDATSLNRTQAALAEAARSPRAIPTTANTTPVSRRGAHHHHGRLFVRRGGPTVRTSARCSSSWTRSTSGAARNCATRRSWTACSQAWAQQVQDAQVVVFGAPPVPGLSVAGGFKLMVEDRGGLGLPTLRPADQRPGRQAAAAARDWCGVSTQFRSNTPQLFLDIDRTKAAALGVPCTDVNQTLGIYLGSLYVNSFNAFGRHWQVTSRPRATIASRCRTSICWRSATTRGRWCRWARWSTCARRAGRSSSTATTSTRPPRSPAACSPGSAPATSSRTSSARADETLLLSMKTEWTELMFMQIRAGDTTLYVFALAVVCVFLALAALYESWSLPLAVILVVPLCLLCSMAGVLASHGVGGHLRADRPGGAGRAGLQELDPDRGVRPATCTRRASPATRPRRRPPGCGCGRS